MGSGVCGLSAGGAPPARPASRPRGSLAPRAGAPSGRGAEPPSPCQPRRTGKRSPLAASGEVGESTGIRSFGDRPLPVRTSGALWRGAPPASGESPARGVPPGWPPGPGRAGLPCAATVRPAGPDGEVSGAAAAAARLRCQPRGMEPGSARPRAPCPELWQPAEEALWPRSHQRCRPVLLPRRGERGARPPRRRRATTGLGSSRSPAGRAPRSCPARRAWGPPASGKGAACRVFTAAADGDQPPDLRLSPGYGGKTVSSFAFPDFSPLSFLILLPVIQPE